MFIDRITSPLQWSRAAHERAVANARAAATDLSRARVEREEVELFLAERHSRRPVDSRPA
jgi:hypothetical protein